MKLFLSLCLALLLVALGGSYLYYVEGVYVDMEDSPVSVWAATEGKTITVTSDGAAKPFEIRGVDMGLGIPGHYATEYAIKVEDYLRWFGQIQEMGANTVRVYTIQHSNFYEAVYLYNRDNPNPLYIIHGLWVDDYVLYSRHDAYDKEFMETMKQDAVKLVDIIHGKRRAVLDNSLSCQYNRDISPWLLGYVLGVEWEDTTVAYTDNLRTQSSSYVGQYMYTTDDATPFEAMLAQVGDTIIAHETKRYSQQRLVAFCNWPTTDPFTYNQEIARYFKKIAQIDVEHIQTTDEFKSGTFASYHIYPYYPDYLHYDPTVQLTVDEQGRVNSYLTYLTMIANHHSMPVVITEFGVPTSRGMSQRDVNTGRNQGGVSETKQAEALVECYKDIMDAGCAGSIIFSWQDEWFKRTWNTMAMVDLQRTPYWSDYQTNEQYFGLLSFDPGKEQSVCYVDGDISEWSEADRISAADGMSLSVKYDPKFLYLMVEGDTVSEGGELYIPIDITPKSGALACDWYGLSFARPVDFVVALNGPHTSRVVVQERYEVLRAVYGRDVLGTDPYEFPPAVDSTAFVPINMMLQLSSQVTAGDLARANRTSEIYETGKLTQGNANPQSPDYNSLADYCYGTDSVEIKLPWQLLNFADPSKMSIHDDYYLHYGVEQISIDELYLGLSVGTIGSEPITMTALPLRGWDNKIEYHERLKPAYYAMRQVWGGTG